MSDIDIKKSKPLKTRKRKTRKVNETISSYPQNISQASANWKRLSQQMHQNDGSVKKTFKTTNNLSNERKNEIWFDGVDKCLIKASQTKNTDSLVKQNCFTGITRIVAMDCEMVGTGTNANHSIVARVSIVNFFGHCLYDKYVKPTEEVTDYRTVVSGIRPSNLVNACEFKTMQKEVNDILKNRVLVGHAIKNDLKVLYLSHPKNNIRDTSRYFRQLFGGRTPSLKRLAETLLSVSVQTGEHDSVEDARVAMRLFTMFRKKWEKDIHMKRITQSNKNKLSKK